MPNPRILSVGTANPPNRFTQAEILALSPYRDERRRGARRPGRRPARGGRRAARLRARARPRPGGRPRERRRHPRARAGRGALARRLPRGGGARRRSPIVFHGFTTTPPTSSSRHPMRASGNLRAPGNARATPASGLRWSRPCRHSLANTATPRSMAVRTLLRKASPWVPASTRQEVSDMKLSEATVECQVPHLRNMSLGLKQLLIHFFWCGLIV